MYAERVFDGRAVPHWVLLVLGICVIGAGPQSLGYLFLGAAFYKLYTLHAAGYKPATMWEEFQASSADRAASTKRNKKRNIKYK